MVTLILFLLSLGGFVFSKTVTYNWDITWVTASPDGFSRPVIGINGKWPCPVVEVDLHDRLVVNVYNKLGNESTSLHWHGLPQHDTAVMDGSSGITQCPIPPGERFTYDFLVWLKVSSFCLRQMLTHGRRLTSLGLIGITLYAPSYFIHLGAAADDRLLA